MTLLALLACGPPTARTDVDPTPPTVVGATPPADDTALLQALLQGDPDAAHALAWSGGFPVATDEDLAFVYDGGGAVRCALSGDFNGWTEDAMDHTGSLWHTRVRRTAFDDGAAYKFVCDAEYIPDPWARSYGYDDFGEISYAVAPAFGHLERWPQLAHTTLATRDLTVWVPPRGPAYDVLYAADGQNLFDPGAAWGGWRMQEALGQRPVLVVGIHNTADRLSEYVHVEDYVLDQDVQPTGDTYAALVHDVIQPLIDERYPTSGRTGLIGSSLGGLISLHIAQRYPGDYDFVASMSGTLGWGRFERENPTIEERWTADPPPGITVYADSGGGPGADGCTDVDGDGSPVDDPDGADNYCVTRQFVDSLAADGFTWDQDLFHWHEPDAPHNEAAWAARVVRPLDIFSPE